MKAKKLTYQELEKRISQLEKELREAPGNKSEFKTTQDWNDSEFQKNKNLTELERTQNSETEFDPDFTESNLKAVIGNSENSIWALDLDFRYVLFNSSYADLFFRGNGIVLKKGISATKYFNPEALNFWVPLFKKVFKGEKKVFEFTHDLSGRKHYYQTSIDPTYENGTVTGAFVVSIDITKAKLTEVELNRTLDRAEESDEKYRFIFDFAPDGLMATRDGKVSHVNKNMLGILGCQNMEEVIGKVPHIWIHPDDQDLVKKRMSDLYQKNTILEPIEYRLINKKGITVDVEVRSASFDDKNGTVTLAVVRNISENKQVAREIRRNEKLLRLFIEHSPAPIAMFDLHMNYIIASKRYYIDYGIEGQDIIGRCHYDVFPEIPERWKKIHQRCFAGETIRAEEDEFMRASGKTDWVRWEIKPWYETEEKIGGIILLTNIITDRKQAEIKIKENEERFRTVFEQSASGMALTSLDGIIMNVNTPFCEMMDYPREELEGKHFNAITFQEDLEVGNDMIKHLLSGKSKKVAFVKRYVKKNGRIIWANVNLALLSDEEGLPNFLIAQIEDITQRMEAEELLSASENKYKALVEQSLTGIYIFDENHFLYVNRRFCEIFGYSEEEIMSGMKPTDVVSVEERVVARQNIDDRLSGKTESVRYTAKGNHKNGKILWVEIHGTHIQLEGKDVITGTVLDITNRKRAEDEIEKLNQELEHKIEERTKDLETKITEIQRMNKLFVGRELRMKELKDEIRELEEKLKKK